MKDWQKIHEEIGTEFGRDGVIGRSLLGIFDAEKAYQSHIIETYHGHRLVFDAFQEFLIETIRLATADSQQLKVTPNLRSLVVHQLFVNFRSWRATDRTFLSGYPLDGFSLLRDLKDRAIFGASVVLGESNWPALRGFDHLYGQSPEQVKERFDRSEVRRRSWAEESRVKKLMIGSGSGLDPHTVSQLAFWEELFHMEVHGSRLTSAFEATVTGSDSLSMSIAPTPNPDSIAMYLNRSEEVAWMHLRLLPYLQKEQSSFGPDWARKWELIDAALRSSIQNLADQGKELFASIVRLVDIRFPFSPGETWYLDRQPSGEGQRGERDPPR